MLLSLDRLQVVIQLDTFVNCHVKWQSPLINTYPIEEMDAFIDFMPISIVVISHLLGGGPWPLLIVKEIPYLETVEASLLAGNPVPAAAARCDR